MGGHVGVRSGMACSGHVQMMTDYCLLASILTAKISQHQDERAFRQRCSQSFMCIQKCTPECLALGIVPLQGNASLEEALEATVLRRELRESDVSTRFARVRVAGSGPCASSNHLQVYPRERSHLIDFVLRRFVPGIGKRVGSVPAPLKAAGHGSGGHRPSLAICFCDPEQVQNVSMASCSL